MRRYFVYILASKSRMLYIGMTNDIIRRIWQHRTASDDSFASRYRIWFLVLLEEYPTARAAIAREKQLKNWRREKKERLIEMDNPQWVDLTSMWDHNGLFAICSSDPCGAPVESEYAEGEDWASGWIVKQWGEVIQDSPKH